MPFVRILLETDAESEWLIPHYVMSYPYRKVAIQMYYYHYRYCYRYRYRYCDCYRYHYYYYYYYYYYYCYKKRMDAIWIPIQQT